MLYENVIRDIRFAVALYIIYASVERLKTTVNTFQTGYSILLLSTRESLNRMMKMTLQE